MEIDRIRVELLLPDNRLLFQCVHRSADDASAQFLVNQFTHL
jgi:hypothetical protein